MTASADILLDMTPPDVSPVAPIDPVDGARDLERPVSLAWTAARDDGAGLAFYRVLCDSMATPSRTAWVDSALSGTLWGANRLTTYRWRVEAVDRAGNLATAGPWDFTTSARPEASVLIPAGVFTMGSPLDEIEHQEDEVQHVVQLTRGFRLSRFEITAGQYVELLQWAYEQGFVAVDAEQAHVLDNLDGASVVLANLNNGFDPLSLADGRFTAAAPDRPIMGLTWFGAVAYCDWLSLREGLPRAYDHATWSCNDGDVYGATGYRLPTESEWEYACRAGATTAFPNGEITDSQDDPLLDLIAWYLYNPYPGLAPVGLLASNAWGLHDMLGNAPEWVHDAYGAYPDGTPENPARDPVALSGAGRVVRGGLYVAAAWGCRAAIRQRYAVSHEFAGLRVALTLPVGNRPY
jgi:sulfatase modifying factor 1